jgi:DNA-binding CsgD family transcriptional regulator/sugar-specific transcriptional regulator TrmB
VLEVLGLSENAEEVYRLMLTDSRLGITELADRLGLAESQARAALDELAGVLLIRQSRERPGRMRVIPPEVGLEALLRRQEQELSARQQQLAQVKTQVAEMVAELSSPRADELSDATERLVGLDAIQAKLEILGRKLSMELLSVMPGGAQSQASIDHARPIDEAALARGVSMLNLCQDSARHDAATYGYARWLTEHGGQVRTAPVLPPRMLIFDRQVAIIPIDPARTRLGAICTSEPAIVASMIAVFDQAWNTAVPLGTIAAADADTGLSRLDQELLKLLAAGMTDEAAGSRLGISARTVRRQMAALMERLNATSRFEAGLKAAQRGWL